MHYFRHIVSAIDFSWLYFSKYHSQKFLLVFYSSLLNVSIFFAIFHISSFLISYQGTQSIQVSCYWVEVVPPCIQSITSLSKVTSIVKSIHNLEKQGKSRLNLKMINWHEIWKSEFIIQKTNFSKKQLTHVDSLELCFGPKLFKTIVASLEETPSLCFQNH